MSSSDLAVSDAQPLQPPQQAIAVPDIADVSKNPGAGTIGGLPTLHEGELLCNISVEVSNYENVFDEKTDEHLEPEEVKWGVETELNQMNDFQVKYDITPQEGKLWGLKVIKSRWVYTRKPKPGNPKAVRARCVAQEHNIYKREDVSQATPPLKINRMVVSFAATGPAGGGPNKKLIGRWDISVAFFHAPSTQKLAVVPPNDINNGKLWFLPDAMNGTREASKQWGEQVRQVVVDIAKFI